MKASSVKSVSMSSALAKKYGGKWRQRQGDWECDDGVRIIRNVIMDMHDENSQTQLCMYFDDGRVPEWVYL